MTSASTVLVAGASRGLGLGLADAWARAGWNTIATARDPAHATALQAVAAKHPGRVVIETLDVEDADAIDALRARLDGGRLDVLFVNAGIFGPRHQDVHRVTRDEIATLFVTNTIAPLRIARRFADRMAPRSVVALMTSQLGSIGDNTSGGYDLYRASKAALNAMVRSWCATLAGPDITVLAMHPGWVRTDMGGANATLSVETSVKGMLAVIDAHRGTGRHGFVDHAGRTLPW
ncbi:MAG: SDR family oxidoreductase [Burkholderiales bacterium]|nr:SDR family oxidoreductase [Burkholderiales bacterium]